MPSADRSLRHWKPEYKALYVVCRATGLTQRASEDAVAEAYPEAYRYKEKRPVAKWERTEAYRLLYDRERERVLEEARRLGFAKGEARVTALNDTAERTYTAMRRIEEPESTTTDWSRLSGVLISTFKEIREEMGPEMGNEKDSPYQKTLGSILQDPVLGPLVAAAMKQKEKDDATEPS